MVRLIEDKRRELEGLCRRYHVRMLEVFGSAALDNMEGEVGDIDFFSGI